MGSLESEYPPTIPILYVNGKRQILPSDAAHRSLLEYLRGIGLTGTKLGCGEGGCGACTVMISNLDPIHNRIVHRAVNACLAPLYSVEGMHVITTEGIGNCREGLHRVQETLATAHGSQCGFCTPGFVMSMYSLLRSSEEPPSHEEIEECLSGNLCRCTGYRPILDAFRVFAKSDDKAYSNDSTAAAGLITHSTSDNIFVCPSTGKPCDCNTVSTNHHCQKVNEKQLINLKPTSGEFIFPPELLTRKLQPLFLTGQPGLTWFRPLKFQDVLDWKLRYPDAKLIGGNTEVGIEVKFKNMIYPVLISTTHIPELNFVNIRDDGLEFGASITLAQLQKALQACVKQRNKYETSSCNALIGQLRWFAGCQIRNVATVGGNICTASPISDLNPLWIASKAIFKISDHKGNRSVDAKDFFVGYRKIAMGKSEVLTSIFLPWTRKHEFVKEFKQAHRREDDIAIVNAGMRVLLSESGGNWIIEEASLAYGGVAPCSLSASITETFLKGKAWNELTMTNAICQLRKEILIAENAPGGMVEFRRSLILSFFFKFFLSISYKLESEANFCHSFPESYKSAVTPYQKPYPVGSQSYQVAEHGTAVGQPLMHLSAKLQVSGEAEYTDDMSMPPNGLHAAFLLSTKSHARIIGIDDTETNSVPGFMGLFTAKDIPGANKIGPVVADEELFATDVVTCVGQVIGIVVGDTQESAKLAVLKVKVFYEELPPILSIDDALKAGSFHSGTERLIQKGNVEDCFSSAACDHTIEGEVRVGGQEHFYLEPNTSLVWTSDGGNEVFMVSSTQTPQKHQAFVAKVLGLPMSKVVCKTKRIGGGFGGKETKSAFIAAAAAVPAYLLRRPVRITLDRDIDMLITGQRHPFLGRYKVGFTSEGKVLALDLEIYSNGGNSLDLSHSVLERAIFHSDNVYAIPNVRIMGKVCYTNLASNTAFRGFGGPQGMIVAENWIEHMSHILGKQPEEIRELNFQKEGYELHYGQRLELSTMEHVWQELKKSCNFEERIIESQDFNKRHRWKKRGVAMVPTKFGISFTTKLLNQAGALVQVYTDGTVLVTHGGVEMGQGLHTKTAQIAASCFGIPSSHVFISETSTDKVPNASPTAASASSDMYGAAVLDACDQIKRRMLSVSERNKHKSFAELASACHMERIDLSAHGFYATPDIGFEWSTGKGIPFNYFTFGAAFAEAEIDTLTGDFQLHRVDIVMDVGKSLNPAIDIGQIEGAFIQGLGWVALEEVKWGDGAHSWVKPGHLFTQGPGTYKLPTANDIPSDFRIVLIKDSPNPRAIHSSKAVGEPPFFLASAAFFAIKDAILAARRESGYNGFFPLDSPATPERIRMACLDDLSQQIAMPDIRPKLSI